MDLQYEPIEARDNTLSGGGEMGRLMREYDWATTPLGDMSHWPQSLRTTISICLASRFPIIIFWGSELRQFYNDAYRPILGKSKHPGALGQRAEECWPEIWNVIGPMLQSVLTTGNATWSENQLLLLDRNGYVEETYFTFSYSPVRDESGEVSGVFCAVTETTNEVLNARRLAILRALAADIAEEHSIEDVCRVAVKTLADDAADLPFTLLYLLDATGSTARLAGQSGLTDETLPALSMVTLADSDAVWPFARVVESGQQRVDLHPEREKLVLANGTSPTSAFVLPITRVGEDYPYGFLIAGINPYHDLDEDYQGFLSLVAGQVATAISSARTLQDARERADALAELDRAKTTFFNNVSHEFRTPLTLLMGPLETLLADSKEPLTESQRAQIEMARRNGLRQLKLVNTLLDFSRIEAGREVAVYEPTDLARLTVDLVSAFRSAVEQAGLRLLVQVSPLPEEVYVDRDMWEKIVFNLLSNALKFTLQGEISVQLRTENDSVVLSVKDTGVGIDPQDLPHLFERFYRAYSPQARTYEGSGIGLALVREIVRMHGGKIEATSQLGFGSTFVVSIPLGSAHLPQDRLDGSRPSRSIAMGAEPYIEEALRWLPERVPGDEDKDVVSSLASAPATVPLPLVTTASSATARILVVDDNADMRDHLRRLLSPKYTVRTVSNGEVALQMARSWLPDLILTDVMMPGVNGFELLSALYVDEQTRFIPVIMLSARAGEEAVVEGLQAGAIDYLVKPFSVREVLARVQAQLEIARLQRESIKEQHEWAQRTQKALETLLVMAEILVNVNRAPDAVAADPDDDSNPQNMYTEHREIRQLLQLTCDLLGCKIASISRVEPETLHLSPFIRVGSTIASERRWWKSTSETSLNDYLSSLDITRLKAGEVLLVDLSHSLASGIGAPDSQRILSAPLRIGEQLVGVLSTNYETSLHMYPLEEEKALLRAIAKLIALVMERERLMQERADGRARESTLREVSRQTDEFISIVSHELKSPLTTIKGNVQLARRQTNKLLTRDGTLSEETASALDQVLRFLERAERHVLVQTRLINDLLDVSRIRTNRLELHTQRCDLVPIVCEVVEDQSQLAARRTIELSIEMKEAMIMADDDRVGQVLNNYISNALKYSEESEPVEVHLYRMDSNVKVAVVDKGPGLTPEQQERIWESFYRVPDIEVKSGSGIGLGLGLHICRTIIERQGGEVGVESTPGQGSTFWFTLPLIESL